MVPPQVTYSSTIAQLKAITESDRANNYTRLVVGPENPPIWRAWYSYHSDYDNALLSKGFDIIPQIIIPNDNVGAWVLNDFLVPPSNITSGFVGRWQAGEWAVDGQGKVEELISLVQGGESLVQSDPNNRPLALQIEALPVVRFEGGQWLQSVTNLGLGGDPEFTFYIVLRQEDFWGYNPVFGWGNAGIDLAACGLWVGNDDGSYSLEFHGHSAVFDRVSTEWSVVAVSKKIGVIADTTRLFVDGQRQRIGLTSYSVPSISNGSLELGRWAGNTVSSFSGWFAELIIYPENHDDKTVKSNSLKLAQVWKNLIEGQIQEEPTNVST